MHCWLALFQQVYAGALTMVVLLIIVVTEKRLVSFSFRVGTAHWDCTT